MSFRLAVPLSGKAAWAGQRWVSQRSAAHTRVGAAGDGAGLEAPAARGVQHMLHTARTLGPSRTARSTNISVREQLLLCPGPALTRARHPLATAPVVSTSLGQRAPPDSVARPGYATPLTVLVSLRTWALYCWLKVPRNCELITRNTQTPSEGAKLSNLLQNSHPRALGSTFKHLKVARRILR